MVRLICWVGYIGRLRYANWAQAKARIRDASALRVCVRNYSQRGIVSVFELSQVRQVKVLTGEPRELRVNTRWSGRPNLFLLSCRQGADIGVVFASSVAYHRLTTAYNPSLSYTTLLSSPASHITSSLRPVLVSLHIGLRAQWSLCPFSASFSSLAANLCAPANHHRIDTLHHRPKTQRHTPGSTLAGT
jgi:hypothetical protein